MAAMEPIMPLPFLNLWISHPTDFPNSSASSIVINVGKPNTVTSAVGIEQICGEMQLIPGTHAAQQWDPKCPSALGSADVGPGQNGLGMDSLSLL